ncbi:MAG: LysR family transcriptional regulator [Rhizobiales bacterium]|nr:LysR family transcriptional regulator [Hyphomicrobiales bacterium]
MLGDLNAYLVFAKVVETSSFTAAAEALKLSKSMVSRQISGLEDALGVRLLNRTTRSLSVTEVGAVVYQHAQRIVNAAEEVEQDVTCIEGAVRGQLRVNGPMSFGIVQLGPVLPEFFIRYPDLTLDLVLNDRRVDLIDEGFDVSLRISSLDDSSLIARQLAPVRVRVVASPGFFKAHGMPTHPRDLTKMNALLYSLQPRAEQVSLTSDKGEKVTVDVSGPVLSNNSDALMPSLLAGLGFALIPDFLCHDYLRNGQLVEALTDWHAPTLKLHAMYPQGRHLSIKVRAFVDFMAEKFGADTAPWVRPLDAPVSGPGVTGRTKKS